MASATDPEDGRPFWELDSEKRYRSAEFRCLVAVIIYFAVATLLVTCYQKCESKITRMNRLRWCGILSRKGVFEYCDLTQTFMSFLLCGFYILETYGVDSDAFHIIERFLTLFFILDYFLRLVSAAAMLKYVFSFFAAVDVLTIAPVMYGMLVASTNTAPFLLRLVRLSKLFRLLRSFRLVRVAPGAGVKREIFVLVFIVSTVILTAAGFFQVIESGLSVPPGEPYAMPFEEALYYATIEVLGRPRLAPSSAWGYVMLICLVALSIVMIPKQLAALFQALQKDPWLGRVQYTPSGNGHYVFLGHIEFPVLNLMLYEIYHPDRGPQQPCDVVILSNIEPDQDIRVLMEHPTYQGKIVWLVGSPEQDAQLERAKVHSAQAVFVFGNKTPKSPEMEDARVVAYVIACKAFNNARLHERNTFSGRRKLRVLAQVQATATRDRLQQMPGWDPRSDVCLVIGELSAAIITLSSVHRGLSTLASNLVSHTNFSHINYYVPKSGRQVEEWYRMYAHGASHEIYHCSVPEKSGLVGQTMLQVASYMALVHSMPLLAIKKGTSRVSGGGRHIVLFPGDNDTIRAGDRVFAVTRSIAHLVRVVKNRSRIESLMSEGISGPVSSVSRSSQGGTKRIWNEETGRSTFEADDDEEGGILKQAQDFITKRVRASKQDFQSEVSGTPAPDFEASQNLAKMELRRRNRDDSETVRQLRRKPVRQQAEEEKSGSTGPPSALEDVLQGTYGGSLEELEADVHRLRAQMEGIAAPEDLAPSNPRRTTSSYSNVSSAALTAARKLPKFHGHILICGGDTSVLAMTAKMMLRQVPDLQIVLMVASKEKMLQEMPLVGHQVYRNVYIVQGTVLRPQDLRNVGVENARAVVVLPTVDTLLSKAFSNEEAAAPSKARSLRRILDTDTILTTNIIATRPRGDDGQVQHVWTVTQLMQESSLCRFFGMAPEAQGGISSFDDRWIGNPPLNIAPLFAAGHIISVSMVDHFLVESLFNPHAMVLVERMFALEGMLIGGKDPEERVEEEIGRRRHVSEKYKDSERLEPTTFQISFQEAGLEGMETYGDVVDALLQLDEPLLALGLFRNPDSGPSSYSLLVSLEAQAELDFRERHFGARNANSMVHNSVFFDEQPGLERSSDDAITTHRLPYVVTNPPLDAKIHPRDLVYVLGRDPRQLAKAAEPRSETPKASVEV